MSNKRGGKKKWIAFLVALAIAGVLSNYFFRQREAEPDAEEDTRRKTVMRLNRHGAIPTPEASPPRPEPQQTPKSTPEPVSEPKTDVAVVVIELTPTMLGGKDLLEKSALHKYQPFSEDRTRTRLRTGHDHLAADIVLSRTGGNRLELRVLGLMGRNSGNKQYRRTEWVITGVTGGHRQTLKTDADWGRIRNALETATRAVVAEAANTPKKGTCKRSIVAQAVQKELAPRDIDKIGRVEVHYLMDHRGIFKEGAGSSRDLVYIWEKHIAGQPDALQIHHFDTKKVGGSRWEMISPVRACNKIRATHKDIVTCHKIEEPRRTLLVETLEENLRILYSRPGDPVEVALGRLFWDAQNLDENTRAVLTGPSSIDVLPDGSSAPKTSGEFKETALIRSLVPARHAKTPITWTVNVESRHDFSIEHNGVPCGESRASPCTLSASLEMEPEHIVRISRGAMEHSPELALSGRWRTPFELLTLTTIRGEWKKQGILEMELKSSDSSASAPITAIFHLSQLPNVAFLADDNVSVSFTQDAPLLGDIAQSWKISASWDPEWVKVELEDDLRPQMAAQGERAVLELPVEARAHLRTLSLATSADAVRLAWSDEGPGKIGVGMILSSEVAEIDTTPLELQMAIVGKRYGVWSPEDALGFDAEGSTSLRLESNFSTIQEIALTGHPVFGAAPGRYPAILTIGPTQEDAIRLYWMNKFRVCQPMAPCEIPFSVSQGAFESPEMLTEAEAEIDNNKIIEIALSDIPGVDESRVRFCLEPQPGHEAVENSSGKEWVSVRRLPDGDWIKVGALLENPCPSEWTANGSYQIRLRKDVHSRFWDFGTHGITLVSSIRSPSLEEGKVNLEHIKATIEIPKSALRWIVEGIVLFLVLLCLWIYLQLRQYSRKARLESVMISGWIVDHADDILSEWKDALQKVTDLKDGLISDNESVNRMVAVLRSVDIELSRTHTILKGGMDQLHGGHYEHLSELSSSNRKGNTSLLVNHFARALTNALSYVQIEYKMALELWRDAASMMVDFQQAVNSLLNQGEAAAQQNNETQLRVVSLSLKQFTRRSRGWLRRVEPTLKKLERSLSNMDSKTTEVTLSAQTRTARRSARVRLHVLWWRLRRLRALAPTHHLKQNILIRILRRASKRVSS